MIKDGGIEDTGGVIVCGNGKAWLKRVVLMTMVCVEPTWIQVKPSVE